jgi:hypothetical protein
MLNPFASPVDGWDLVELSETCTRLSLPPNDLHGAVYYKTREMVCYDILFCPNHAPTSEDTSFYSIVAL